MGLGVTADDDPIVFVAPVELAELRVGPPVDPLNPDRFLLATALPIDTGILAIDLAPPSPSSPSWWWLATGNKTKNNKNSFYSVRGPCFSPDGSAIAFGATRTDGVQTPYFGVYMVPFFSVLPPLTRVAEIKGTKSTGGYYVTVNNWNFP